MIDLAAAQRRLAELVAIPGVSAKAFPPGEVRRSAEAVAETLVEYGLGEVRLLETAGHPAVYGEVRGSSGSSGSSGFLGGASAGGGRGTRGTPRNPRNPEEPPTILIYGHHDVQPPGREERWLSPPFEATIRDGRMYGRGTSDDKGGFLAYLEAIRACLADGSLPCNVKLLIEGEEEIGSPHLAALLAEQRALFACDYIVLCDTPNFDTGVPALTYRLRGNCIVDVEVRVLGQPLHSGQGGGLVPDAIVTLCAILARLQEGIPGLEERVHVDDSQLAAIRALPFDAERVRADFGLLDACSSPARPGSRCGRVPPSPLPPSRRCRSRRRQTSSPTPHAHGSRCAPCATSAPSRRASCWRRRSGRTRRTACRSASRSWVGPRGGRPIRRIPSSPAPAARSPAASAPRR
ncbi:MAG TPA: M20/M25/M40 family metallo-hydrolase [Thermoanaerobaculia bacterium]